MEIREELITAPFAQELIAELDQELLGEYAPEHMHTVAFDSFDESGGLFFIAYEADLPIACAALRPLSNIDVELKRMYVRSSFRGQGVSRALLERLEHEAKQHRYSRLLLETGDEQHAAIRLYESSGFERVAAFGEYRNSPRSICFCKQLIESPRGD